MRRKPLVGLAVAGVALGLPAAALAAFTQSSNVVFTGTTHSARPAGVSANMKSGGDEPRDVHTVTVTFPRNTKFRLGTVPACTLTNKQIESGKNCPAKSKISSDSGSSAVIQAGTTPFPATVKAYAAGAKQMIVVIHLTNPAPITKAIRPGVSGRQLLITVPNLSPFFLKQLRLKIPKRGTGTHALISSGNCVNKQWTVKSAFTYYSPYDNDPRTVTSSKACTG